MDEPTAEQVELIVDAAYQFDGELEVYEGYSGRGMFGQEVTAITGDGDDRVLFLAIGYLIGQGELDSRASWWFRRADSMGLGWVRY